MRQDSRLVGRHNIRFLKNERETRVAHATGSTSSIKWLVSIYDLEKATESKFNFSDKSYKTIINASLMNEYGYYPVQMFEIEEGIRFIRTEGKSNKEELVSLLISQNTI